MGRLSAYALLLLLVAGVLVADSALVLRRAELRRRFDAILAGNLTAKPDVGDVGIDILGNAWAENLTLARGGHPVLSIGRVEASFDWRALIEGRPVVSVVRILDPVLRLREPLEDTAAFFKSLFHESGAPTDAARPRIEVSGLRIEIHGAGPLDEMTPLVVDGITATLDPFTTLIPGAWRLEGAADTAAYGRVRLSGDLGPGVLRVDASAGPVDVQAALMQRLDVMTRNAIRKLVEIDGAVDVRATVDLGGGRAAEGLRVGLDVGLRRVNARFRTSDVTATGLSGWIHWTPGGILHTDGLVFEIEGGAGSLSGDCALRWGAPEAGGAGPLDGGVTLAHLDLRGAVKGLRVDQLLGSRLRTLPHPGPTIDSVLGSLAARGVLDGDFRIREEPDLPTEVEVSLELGGVSACYGMVPPARPPDPADGEPRRSWGFPYPVEDIRGTVRIDRRGVVLDGLAGRHGDALITIRGEMRDLLTKPDLWVLVEGHGVPFDEALVDAVNARDKSHADVLRHLGLSGSADIAVKVRRRPEDDRARVRIEAELRKVVATPAWFPVEIRDLAGRVVVEEGEARFSDLEGRRGPGLIHADGRIDLLSGAQDFVVDLRATAVPLDYDVCATLGNLSAGVKNMFTDYFPEGTVSLAGRIACSGSGGVGLDLAVDAEGMTLRPELSPDLELRAVAGRVVVRQAAVESKGGGGRTAIHLDGIILSALGREVEITGQASFGTPGRGPTGPSEHHLHVRSRSIDVDAELLTALEPLIPALPDVRNIVALSGPVSFDFDSAGGRVDTAELTIRAHDMRIEPGSGLPLSFDVSLDPARTRDLVGVEGVRGIIRVSTSSDGDWEIELESLSGVIRGRPDEGGGGGRPVRSASFTGGDVATDPAVGDMSFGLASAEIRPYREPLEAELRNLHLRNVSVKRWLYELLPEEQRLKLAALNLHGAVDLELVGISVRGGQIAIQGSDLERDDDAGAHRKAKKQTVPRRASTIHLRQAGMDAGLPISFNDAWLDIEDCTIDAGDFFFRGRLRDSSLEVGNLLFEGICLDVSVIEGALSLDAPRSGPESNTNSTQKPKSSKPAETEGETIGFGSHCSGYLDKRAPGDSAILMLKSGDRGLDFRASLAVQDLHLAELLPRLTGRAAGAEGMASVELTLAGNLEDRTTWSGDGRIRFVGKELWHLPLISEVLTFLNYDLTRDPRSEAGLVHFTVHDQRIRLTNFVFEGPDLRLDGDPTSEISFGGIANIACRTKFLKWIPDIPLISDILSILKNPIAWGVSLRGPIEDPTVEMIGIFDALGNPDPDAGRRIRLKGLRPESRREK